MGLRDRDGTGEGSRAHLGQPDQDGGRDGSTTANWGAQGSSGGRQWSHGGRRNLGQVGRGLEAGWAALEGLDEWKGRGGRLEAEAGPAAPRG